MRRPPMSRLFPYTTLFRSSSVYLTCLMEMICALPSEHRNRLLENVYRRLVLGRGVPRAARSEEHTSELQSRLHLVCRLLLEKKNKYNTAVVLKSNHKSIRH